MKIEIDVEIPEGYEATGEYRPAIEPDHYLSIEGEAVTGISTMSHKLILRKKKKKVYVFIPVDTYGEATLAPYFSTHYYGSYKDGYICPIRFDTANVQWYRVEEREE